MNVGAAATSVIMGRQVASLSRTGSVAVTQSTILRSPVVVFCRAGWSRSTPESRTPIVMPRPSYVGCDFLKSTEPMSCVGMYGLASGVFLPGAATFAAAAPALVAGAGSSGTVSSRSTAVTVDSFETFSTAPVGTLART